MNRKLAEQRDPEAEVYNPEGRLSDEELYDQIYFARFFQSLNSKERKWFALASIGLMNADKKLTRSEMNFVNSIVRSDRDKATVEYYVGLVKQKSKPNLETLRVSEDQAYRMLIHLSQILISGKSIGSAEEEYLSYICSHLGVDPQGTSALLKIIKHKTLGNYMCYKLREYLGNANPIFKSRPIGADLK